MTRAKDPKSIDFLLLSPSLNMGGAEKHLVRLAQGLCDRDFNVLLIELGPRGRLIEELVGRGITLKNFNKDLLWIRLMLPILLFWEIKKNQPRAVYSILPIPNIFSALLAMVISDVKFVWGIRSSSLEFTKSTLRNKAVLFIEKKLSEIPDAIVFNSKSGRNYFASLGFAVDRAIVVRNGVDLVSFKQAPDIHSSARMGLEIPQPSFVVGIVARAEYNKGPDLFLEAISRLLLEDNEMYGLIVGRDWEGFERLNDLRDRLGKNRLMTVGECVDVRPFLAAMDVFLLTSRHEGTPNALLEAMACGVPCVATDVGDVQDLLGRCDYLTESEDVDKLVRNVQIIRGMSVAQRTQLGQSLRARAEYEFSVEKELEGFLQILDRS
jgi:glycosyltransferase involved in cell wall biosynthesis